METTTTVIPKAQLKSCQRWKWQTLDPLDYGPVQTEEAQTDMAHEDKDHAEKPAAESKEAVATIFEQARENGHKQGLEEGLTQGHQEGYDKGYQEGHDKGHQEGREQGDTEARNASKQIQAVFDNLNQQLQTLDQQIAQDILTFAIDLTKRMISQSLTVHPELILPIVQDAIRLLPDGMPQPRLFLNPADAKIVRHHLTEQTTPENWEILDDDEIIQGGCRIEAGGTEIDASIETRWRRALAAIGQHHDWVEK